MYWPAGQNWNFVLDRARLSYWMLHQYSMSVNSWASSFVQSTSSSPFYLPLLYLYCQKTSFHLGLLYLCQMSTTLYNVFVSLRYLEVPWKYLKFIKSWFWNKEVAGKKVSHVIRTSQYLYHRLPNIWWLRRQSLMLQYKTIILYIVCVIYYMSF